MRGNEIRTIEQPTNLLKVDGLASKTGIRQPGQPCDLGSQGLALSIGVQSGPPIGAQKGPPC